MQTKISGVLGLAKRAGKLICGTEAVCEGIRRKKAVLAVIASDVSANTEKRITDSCAYYKTEYIKLPLSMAEISDAVGKTANTASAYISDANFAKALRKAIDEDGGCVYGNSNKY